MRKIGKCFECASEAHHNHHVVPRVVGGTQTVPLCTTCHGLAHSMKMAKPELTKIGLYKAKLEGKILGRPKTISAEIEDQIISLHNQKYTKKAIAIKLRVSKGTVWRVCKKYKAWIENQILMG